MIRSNSKTYWFLRYLTKIYSVVVSNTHRKRWLKHFYASHDVIHNWLFLYFYSSSFILDLLFYIYRFITPKNNIQVKARYKNSMVLYFPALSSRYYGMFTDIVAYQYIDDYEKYYKKKFSLKENDVVIDVGAHVGKFAIPLVMEFPRINIYAFEPDPANFECLEKNFQVNLSKNGKYDLYQGVVSDNVDEKIFSLGRFSTQGSLETVGFSYEDKNARHIKVKSFTLEKLFKENNINRCALLKMDCEGSEYLIFESLSKGFLKKINMIFIEVHIIKDRKPLMLKDFFERNGFIVQGHERSDGGWEMFCVNSLSEVSEVELI